MKLSFVIPAYNEEAYIAKCLGSITTELINKNHDVEIIVVNNASTDATKQVALSFPGVRVVDEPRKGITFARQAGLLVSTGDLIANVDADSILTPGWVETVLAEFEKHPALIAFSGPFIYYDLSLFRNLFVRLYYRICYAGYLLNRHVLRIGSMLQGGNFVVKRSALETIGGFDLNCSFYGEDTDVARRLHPLGPVKFSFTLPMYSSGRRIQHEGALTMAAKYPLNYLWMMFFKKPFTKDYIDIRKKESATFSTDLRKVTKAIIAIQTAFSILALGTSALLTYNNIQPGSAQAISLTGLKERRTILLQKARQLVQQAKDEASENLSSSN